MTTILKFTLTLLILLNFISFILTSENSVDREDEDLQDLEQLLAVDNEEASQNHNPYPQINLSEADHLRKSQRIVLELSNDKTTSVINTNQYVLVLGYAPWCGRSAELMPQFAEAANTLKEMGSELLMAKIDGERYSQAASGIGIKGFPTLLFFVNGSSQVYTGGFTAKEIVVWARKKTGVPVIRVNSVAEAEEFLAKHQIYVVGLFEKFEGSKYEEFAKAAIADNEIQFAETSNTEVAKLLFPGLETSDLFLGLVKDEEEKYVTFDDTFQEDNILNFLEYNKFPLVTVMTELNSVRVHSGPVKLQVMVFAEDKEFKNLRATLQNVAKKFKSKIMFLYVNIAEENLAKPFLSLFGLEESAKTVVTGFDNKNSAKYLLEKDLTPDNLEEFCSGLLHGTLSQYFKSQPIPDNKEESVLIVVGKTFDELVLHSPQNILLEVHTPWCINCEATSKQVEKLAKHFKGLDNLIISRIDASLNEHPKLQVDDFPTLLFYPSGDKSNPIKLSSKSRLKDLAAFIKKNVKVDDQSVKEEL